MTSVLVAGARGIVGKYLIAAAADRDFQVFGISRRALAHTSTDSVSWLTADLEQPFGTAFPQADVWIHAAPLWLLPLHIPEIRSLGVQRIIAFSSTSAVTKIRSRDSAERVLAAQLRNSEISCLTTATQQGMGITVLRPTMIYGYGRDANVSAIARLILRYRVFPLPRHALGLRQPVHVDDLVCAALAIIDNIATLGKIYSLSGGEVLTYKEMVARIFTGLGLKPHLWQVPTILYRRLAHLVAGVKRGDFPNSSTIDRMSCNFNFSHHQAMQDFSYRPAAFLENPNRDLAVQI